MRKTTPQTMRSNKNYFPVHVVASTHQGDPSNFSAGSVGKQCVANSTCAIIKAHLSDIDLWRPKDMDHILQQGDGLYRLVNSPHDYLEIEEIPLQCDIFGRKWDKSIVFEVHATGDTSEILNCLRESFKYTSDAVVMLGDVKAASAMSVMHQNNAFYTFDPHSRSMETGLPVGDGRSLVAKFPAIESLATYLFQLGQSLKAEQFSIWAVRFNEIQGNMTPPTVMCQYCGRQLDNEFNRLEHEAKCTRSHRQKRKKGWICRHCERQLDNKYNLNQHQTHCAKRCAKKIKQEWICKHCKRPLDNETNLKQHETACEKKAAKLQRLFLSCKHCNRHFENKTKMDQHESLCQHTSSSREKASFTCDICHRSMGNLHNLVKHQQRCSQNMEKAKLKEKQQKAKDQKYNTEWRKEARKHDDFREKEQQHDTKRRKEARKDSDVHEKEQQQDTKRRKDARKDPNVHEKEQQQNTKWRKEARKDPNVHEREQQQNTKWRKEARKDPDVHEKEQRYNTKQRKEARKRPGIRQMEQMKDTPSKKKKRENSRVKQVERQQQQQYRKERRSDSSKKLQERERVQRRTQEQQSDPIYQEEQFHRRQVKHYGENLAASIKLFFELTRNGPIYVCTACHQTMFIDDVDDVSKLRPRSHADFLNECRTGHISVDGKEWLCHTCKRDIYQGLYPKMSIKNKVGFPERPPELDIDPLEETIIAPLLPFMKIMSLPVGGLIAEGQKLIKGNVVHVPNNIASTVEKLPRQLNDMGTIMLRLKRKLEYKSAAYQSAIRPKKCMDALKYLKETSPHYEHIVCDLAWIDSLAESSSENRLLVEGLAVQEDQATNSADQGDEPKDHSGNQDDEKANSDDEQFEEVPESANTQGNLDTLLDENDPLRVYQDAAAEMSRTARQDAYQDNTKIYNIAPGEGQVPVFRDAEAEYKCFPTIFCGQERPKNEERFRPISTAMLYKAELRNKDPRVSLNLANIFWKACHLKIKQVMSTCHLALRKLVGSKHRNVTAADLLNPETRDTIQRLNEGFHIFRAIRNSPPYFEHRKKEVNAMIRQLGIPTFFFSLSSADTRWVELIKCLAKRVDNEDLTEEYIQNEMTAAAKNKLVSSDPATCARFFHHRVQKFLQLIIMGPHSPIGKIKDFFYRVEFQKRGSPHIHGFLWSEDAPDFDTATDEEVCEYIDTRISCSTDVTEEEKPFLELQKHSHSRSCKRVKRDQEVCRFGAPWPPMRKTQILHPLEEDKYDDRLAYQKRFNNIMKKLKKLPENVTTFEEWLQFIEMEEDEYHTLIRSTLDRKKIFLIRGPTETRINAYMKGLLHVWKGNHDIQFVLNPYQCVSYILDYMTKSSKGVSEVLQAANEEAKAGNMDVKKATRHIANKFLNAAESPIQQCCFDILGLPITNSSRRKEFINTNPPELRVGLAKPIEVLKDLKPDSKAVIMQSNIDHYARRPKLLENWSLAEFVAKTSIEYPKRRHRQEDEDHDPETLEMHEEDAGFIEEEGFPYVMRNGQILHRRQRNKVIRFRRYSKKTDPENHYRELLLLYTPWRSETELLHGYPTYEEAFKQTEGLVHIKQREFEPMSTELAAAYEAYYTQLQEAQENSTEDEQESNEEEDPVPQSDLPIMAPDADAPLFRVDIGPALGIAPTQSEQDESERVPMKMSDSDYFKLLGLLNTKQQEFHSHIMHHALYVDQQILAVLHGGAGTGKSTVIKAVSEGLERIIRNQPGKDFSGPKIILMAPTGKAAYNIGGETIHRALYVPANQRLDYKSLSWDPLNTLRSKYNGVDWVIIDEFSMVGKRLLYFMNLRLQEIRGNQQLFGGMNMILVGDLHQLKPVKDGWIFEDMGGPYGALAPNIFKENFCVFELIEIMRQRDDKVFAESLNRIRRATHTPQDIALLRTRLISTQEALTLSEVPHFFVTNAKKDEYNDLVMQQSQGKTVTIRAKDVAPTDIPKSEQRKALAAAVVKPMSGAGNLPYELVVKEGLRYDITANISPLEGIVNGAECTIRHVEPPSGDKLPICIWVEFSDEAIGRDTRRRVGYAYRRFAEKGWTPITPVTRTFVASRNNYTMSRLQYPLQMSSGRTIHKAQSATHEQAVVDMSGTEKAPLIFWEHMHYVAFSRCTTLQGLHIIDINESKIRASASVTQYLEKEKRELELNYCPVYSSDHQLAIAFNNVGSLPHKWPAIKNNKNIIAMDLFILAETWLSKKYPQNAFQLLGFKCVRMDSEHRVGHRGMLAYISEEHESVHTEKIQTPHIEAVICQEVVRGERWNIIGVYKPPTTSREILTDELDAILSRVNLDRQTIVVGDLNVNVHVQSGKWLVDHMQERFNLHQVVTNPTTWAGTLIDIMFTNNTAVQTCVLGNTWSKHDMIYGVVSAKD